jgi:prepilin-type N-terminal cleavage/methylation domain-containing protein
MRKDKRGFTLIELLIVIGLIGVLTTFFVNTASLNIKRARDSRRKSDLELIRSGIETYRADCNTYPTTLSYGAALKGTGSPTTCLSSNTYISIVPADPTPSQSYVYSTANGGQTYQICASLEAPASGTSPVTCAGSTSCGSGTCNYQVINP